MPEIRWFIPPWVLHGDSDPDNSDVSVPVECKSWDESLETLGLSDEAILRPLQEQFGQIKSRQRVRDLAEVFTNPREIDAILDGVAEAFDQIDVKFLEPAAGNGNFLVEILRRKLRLVSRTPELTQEMFEFRILRAIASMYAIDISSENVTESRIRLAHELLGQYAREAPRVKPTLGFLNAAAQILGDNIVIGDTLSGVENIELCEWVPSATACFRRIWSPALVPESNRDLFWAERIQDEIPVHFSELVATDLVHEIHPLKSGVNL